MQEACCLHWRARTFGEAPGLPGCSPQVYLVPTLVEGARSGSGWSEPGALRDQALEAGHAYGMGDTELASAEQLQSGDLAGWLLDYDEVQQEEWRLLAHRTGETGDLVVEDQGRTSIKRVWVRRQALD